MSADARDAAVERAAEVLFPIIHPQAAQSLANGWDAEWDQTHVRAAEALAEAYLLKDFPSDEAGKNREDTTPTTPEASGRGSGAGLRSPVEWLGLQPSPPGATIPGDATSHDAKVKAEAWDEGYEAACRVSRSYGHVDYWENEPSNPYMSVADIVRIAREDAEAEEAYVADRVAKALAEQRVSAQRAWNEGHKAGWEHHQDGNYGNDYWDDETPNPYRGEIHPFETDEPYNELSEDADGRVLDS
jgi:hypothetical protein